MKQCKSLKNKTLGTSILNFFLTIGANITAGTLLA